MKATKRPRPVVTTDGDGVVSHAGSYLLIELADRVGLTAALSREFACLLAVSPDTWVPAITQDGDPRDGAAVCELHDLDSAPGPPLAGPSAGVSGPIPALSSPSPITTGFAFRCSSPTRLTPIWRRWRRVTAPTPGSRTASAAARRRGCATFSSDLRITALCHDDILERAMEALGFVAGALTTACWLPQVLRTIRTRSAADISWVYLGTLTVGIVAWVFYGVGRGDPAIIAANAATLGLVSGLSGLKLTLARGARSGIGVRTRGGGVG